MSIMKANDYFGRKLTLTLLAGMSALFTACSQPNPAPSYPSLDDTLKRAIGEYVERTPNVTISVPDFSAVPDEKELGVPVSEKEAEKYFFRNFSYEEDFRENLFGEGEIMLLIKIKQLER